MIKKNNSGYTIILLIMLVAGGMLFISLAYAEQNAPMLPVTGSIIPPDKSPVNQKFSIESKEPNLPVILIGTIVEPKPADSFAVIKDTTSQKQRVCRVGEQILGYQIAKILRGRVVLLKEGKISLLDFPLGREVEPVVVVSDGERIINRSVLAKKIPDLNTAVQKVIPIPYVESGKIMGFKILKLKDKELARMAGVKEGDVVLSVNGEKLDSIRKALDIYSRVKGQEEINLEIKRGKEIKDFIYHIL